MEAGKWSIADDCAHWLRSDALDAGRRELRESIADLEQWFIVQRRSWQKVKIVTTTVFVISASLALLVVASQGTEDSDIAIAIGAVAFMLWALAWNFPRILQQYPFRWEGRRPFSDPRIERLREYFRYLVDQDRRLFTIDGRPVDAGILKQEWALLYLTGIEELYTLPVLAGADIHLKRYEGGLFIEKPSKPESLLSATHETKVFVYIDQRSSNTTVNQHIDITELHNHFNFVSQLRADISAFESPLDGPDINHPASRENAKRWPCEFDDEDYEIRLLIFETKTLPGMARVEPHQIGKYVAAVDGARQHWQANPRMTIEQTADLIGPLVAKISDGKSGLNHTNSVAWIRSVIGGTGEYAFIKDAFKSIQYDPEQFGPIQYRLLL